MFVKKTHINTIFIETQLHVIETRGVIKTCETGSHTICTKKNNNFHCLKTYITRFPKDAIVFVWTLKYKIQNCGTVLLCSN